MESLQMPMNPGTIGARRVKYDDEKITRIRQRIEIVFGSASTMNDAALCERFNITPDGELLMIL
jgi:hypothetical protein